MQAPHDQRLPLIFLVLTSVIVVTLGCCQDASGACAPEPPSLISWWPATGNAFDIIGTNNGTLLNGTTFESGEVGQAFSFNGTNQYVEIPDAPSLDPVNISIEAWVYPTTLPASTVMIVAGKDGASANRQYLLALKIVGNQFIARPHVGVAGGYMYFDGTTPVPLNAWTHLAMTYDGTTLKLYVNGALDGSLAVGGPILPTPEPLRIGGLPTGPWYFTGLIDEVSLYSSALSGSEIENIYSAGAAGKCTTSSPVISTQPQDEAVPSGLNANFSVVADGTPPLSYQWTFNSNNIPNATNSTLVLDNVQPSQSGPYTVVVTNSYGSITSTVATLTLLSGMSCTPPPAVIAGWWRGELDASDAVGADDGALQNGVTFGKGLVGDAFLFNGVNQFVQMADSPSLDPTNITIEAWVYPTVTPASTVMIVVGKDGASVNRQYLLALKIVGGQLIARPHVGVSSGYTYFDAATPIPLNAWTHLAMTYDGSVLKLYVNGALDGSLAVGGGIIPTPEPLRIGGLPTGPWYFTGLIDEASLYSAALPASAIQAIYNAGSVGKCPPEIPATILNEPVSTAITEGQSATFTVVPSGTSPFSYQWFLNGSSLPGATDSSLVLTNVQRSQAGSYSVMVTNAYGSATSSNATLVVNFPPATVSLSSVSGTAGQIVTVPVVLMANGNENAVGFSVDYPPNLLTNVGVSLGSGAWGATLVVNPNQPGTLGLGVALPSGMTFTPGTQEVAEINFVAAVSPTNYSTPLTLGDSPTARLLSDAKANALAANFTGGQVTVTRASFEADVAPRPGGDGQITIVDWVQVGRFVAGLDTPSSSSEFQRADCAPRTTFGDGLLTVSDWVQAGRYAAGLDAPALAAGPTAPAGGQVVLGPLRKRGTDPQRSVTVQGPLIFDGQTGAALIQLNAQGDENAVGFSLSFDPTMVTYTGASTGTDAAGATMDINANQATNGQLGIILELPTDTAFSPGLRQLVKVNFQAVTPASLNTAVALTDLPVIREVSDTNALPVASTYTNGIIELNPKPSLTIGQSSQAISLSWPLWATNYTLQQAGATALSGAAWTNVTLSPLVTTNAESVTLPVGGSVQFYRLKQQ